jgi:hypothetical protein
MKKCRTFLHMQPQPLSPHIKLTFGICAMIGIAAFVFGMIRMQRTIALPFTRRTDVVYKDAEQLQKEREEKLKTTDSDTDTISDYDEMFIFKTSAYLTDTDSDGESDNQEIAAGQDPNCPKGKTCRVERTPAADGSGAVAGANAGTGLNASAPAPDPLTADQIAQAIVAIFGPLDKLTPESISTKVDAMSTEELSNFLLAIGLPQETISRTDEAALRKIVSGTIGELTVQKK